MVTSLEEEALHVIGWIVFNAEHREELAFLDGLALFLARYLDAKNRDSIEKNNTVKHLCSMTTIGTPKFVVVADKCSLVVVVQRLLYVIKNKNCDSKVMLIAYRWSLFRGGR